MGVDAQIEEVPQNELLSTCEVFGSDRGDVCNTDVGAVCGADCEGVGNKDIMFEGSCCFG